MWCCIMHTPPSALLIGMPAPAIAIREMFHSLWIHAVCWLRDSPALPVSRQLSYCVSGGSFSTTCQSSREVYMSPSATYADTGCNASAVRLTLPWHSASRTVLRTHA